MKNLRYFLFLAIFSTCCFLIYLFFIRSQQSSLSTAELLEQKSFYAQKVEPILDSKCIACHSCFNSPCQLDLSSYDGVLRGAHKTNLYEFPDVNARKPTRMHVDASSEKEWREKGFFSVLGKDSSILSSMITELPGIESGKQDQFQSEQKRYCISSLEEDELESLKEMNPAARMPYGFPALSSEEINTIKKWQELGAIGPSTRDLETKVLKHKDFKNLTIQWETLLNRKSLQAKISARYIYEHLFLAHIYFDNYPNVFFRLVRSKTAKGLIDEIATDYPFDSPGKTFSYRLRPVVNTISHKRHIPFPLTDKKFDRWENQFFKADWGKKIKDLPAYGRPGANPFKTFADIPTKIRYQFFLDEAAYHIMTFIKGPVCRGQTALNVINDHFWVLFLSPENDPLSSSEELYNKVAQTMKLPAEIKDDLSPSIDFRKNYWSALKHKFDYLEKSENSLSSSWLWNGGGTNSNSLITVYRHFDSANVLRGLRGTKPKTVWVLDYHVFESIYYNLTAGYNVFGPMLHQLNSRLYMEISRIASEDLFISFLPKEIRQKTRNSWNISTPDAKESTLKWISDIFTADAQEKMKYEYVFLGNNVKTLLTKNEHSSTGKALDGIILRHFSNKQISPALESYKFNSSFIKNSNFDQLPNGLSELSNLDATQSGLEHLPEVILMRVKKSNGEDQAYTLLHNKDHYNVSMLFFEKERLNPKNNTIDILEGITASYANLFFVIDEAELIEFTKGLKASKSPRDVWKLLKKYSLSRSDKSFWDEYKWFSNQSYSPLSNERGWLDLNRYLNI